MSSPRDLTLVTLALAALLAGCATPVPPSIRSGAADALTVAQARESGGQPAGTRVRWGGRILAVHNAPDTTQVQVLSLPLSRDGEPQREGGGQGRFIARVQGFLDPAVYAEGRLLTVYGVLAGAETRPVGEYAYVYPVVDVVDRHLWEEVQPAPPRDPWCDPWDPFYGYPYGWPGWRPWPHCW